MTEDMYRDFKEFGHTRKRGPVPNSLKLALSSTTHGKNGERGQLLVGALLMLLVLAVLTPALVFLVQNESKMSMKQKRTTAAFYAAEAGIERALWVLRSSSATFDDALDGIIPSGYLNELTYTDINEGSYRVLLSSTTVAKEVRVESTGRDKDEKAFRAIEVLLLRDSTPAAIYAPATNVFGGARIYWGPLMSTGAIDLAADEFYPRKLSRGAITGSPDRDTNPTPPNTDDLEWWSYNESPGVPDTPAIDLDYYREQSKAETGCPAGGTPAGSCYYTTNQSYNNFATISTRTYYFEANVAFGGSTHFRGTVIVMGGISFVGGGQGASGGIEYGDYIPEIPTTAYLEYRKNAPDNGDDCLGVSPPGGCVGGGPGATDDGDYDNADEAEGDDACCHQYPGDHGIASTETFKFGTGCVAHGDLGGGPADAMSFKGFMYVKGNMKVAGNTAINGVVMSDSGSFSGGGTVSIFYDASLEVQVTAHTIVQTSWKELIAKPF
ncbi:MAG: PilX N-terminal domain-containing pilus assembly protein [Elusimicrobiota bacterium]